MSDRARMFSHVLVRVRTSHVVVWVALPSACHPEGIRPGCLKDLSVRIRHSIRSCLRLPSAFVAPASRRLFSPFRSASSARAHEVSSAAAEE
jgi:hypothetical protein